MTGESTSPSRSLPGVISTQGYACLQLLLTSVYSGAFHATAEGQVITADAVVDKARAVLAKYENRRPHGGRGWRPCARVALSCSLPEVAGAQHASHVKCWPCEVLAM
jgi:hypothetical protein